MQTVVTKTLKERLEAHPKNLQHETPNISESCSRVATIQSSKAYGQQPRTAALPKKMMKATITHIHDTDISISSVYDLQPHIAALPN